MARLGRGFPARTRVTRPRAVAAAAPQTVDLAGNAISSTEAFGAATIRLTVFPAGVASGEVFGSDRIVLTVAPGAIASGEVVSTGDRIAGTVTVAAVGSAEAFGTPTVAAARTLTVTGIPSAAAVGAPTILGLGGFVAGGGLLYVVHVYPDTQIVSTQGVPSLGAVGSPRLRVDRLIAVRAIQTLEAHGRPVIVRRASARQRRDERDML